MLIIIEGTDASGKSTLVAEVQRQLAASYPDATVEFFHKSKPAELTRRWVLNDYVQSIEASDWSARMGVADRWHWGEATYAPLKRPATNKDGFGLLGVAGWRWTELFLMSRGVAQFLLYQPLDVIEARLASRGDDYVSVEELESILAMYEHALVSSSLAGVLSPPAESLDTVASFATLVIDIAERMQDDYLALRQFPSYIGPRYPKVLLVGDRQNITKRYEKETKLPFMPVDGNSGEFLLSALPEEAWKVVGIVNANDIDMQTLDALWDTIGKPPIVALGRMAERALIAADIDHYVTTYHPQHVRRFFHSEKQEYGKAIMRLAQTQGRGDKWALR